jgi:flagellar L-ring protein precursor FlgH
LFVDRRARLTNDVVTVRIVESSTASGEATTEADRTSTVQGSLEGLFGFEDKVIRNNGVDPSMLLQGSLTSGFDGSGSTARKNTLNATITAVVREVFPNGTLYIEGRKEVVINHERQYIILSGIIRPDDIQTDNSIASDRIADARVVYSGSGAVSDKQRPGWFGRVIDLVWPF